MLNGETSIGADYLRLRRIITTIKTGGCCKSDKCELLHKVRDLAASIGVELGNHNSPDFGRMVFN